MHVVMIVLQYLFTSCGI